MDSQDLPEALTGALVVAVDDSPSARQALRFAADLAAGLSRPLHVLTIWNFITGEAPADQPFGTPPTLEAWQQESERRLALLLEEELGGREGLEVRPVSLHGNTTPTLLKVSQVAAQLVIGSRGRGGFTGLLLGSTSEQVLRHAGCPVTVVHAPRT